MPVTSRIFKSGNSDAVRLPKDMTFGQGVEVEIQRKGDVLTIVRKRPTIQEMIARLDALPKPSGVQKRDLIMPPIRKGL